MSVKLLTEHHLEFLSLIGGYTGSSSSKSTLVKMTHCWKAHIRKEYTNPPHLKSLEWGPTVNPEIFARIL